MLDPIYLWYVADTVVDIWNELNEWAIRDIAERIMAAELYDYDKLPGTARWRAWLLKQSGMHYDEIVSKVSKLSKRSEEAVRDLFVEAGLMSVENDAQIYEKHDIEVPDIRQDKRLTQILEGAYNQTNGELRNYTRTTLDASNKLMIDTLDKAYFDIKTGNRSYSEVIKEAIETVSKEGLTVTYPSGHRDTIETAVRRAVMTGLNQGTAKISIANCEKLGAKYVVISAHEGARTSDDPVANHLGWQGKIYKLQGSTKKYKNLEEATGFPNNPLGLCGYNCRHNLYPYFLGDPNPWEDIANKAEENKESYEIAQKQRQMERTIRKSKQQLLGYQAGIDNCADEETKFELQMEHDRLANRLQRQNKTYNEFCKGNDLVKESDRLRVAGWNRSTADKARSGANRYYGAKYIKPKLKNINAEAEELGIQEYNKNVNPEIAMQINSEIKKARDVFGEFTIKSINALEPSVNYDGLYEGGRISLKNINGDGAAQRLREKAVRMKKEGKWSTNSELHTFRHEMGHAIVQYKQYTDDGWGLKLEKVQDIMNNILREAEHLDINQEKKLYASYLSRYAMQDIDEFIAEAIAEYLNQGKTRNIANRIVMIIRGE